MENNLPVNIPGGVPTILDGAGAIKDVVSEDAVENINTASANANTSIAVNGGSAGQYADIETYMRQRRTKPIVRDYNKIGRNDPCPCGSGKKYKKCCLESGKYEGTHQLGSE